jgi:hypothetical protein
MSAMDLLEVDMGASSSGRGRRTMGATGVWAGG